MYFFVELKSGKLTLIFKLTPLLFLINFKIECYFKNGPHEIWSRNSIKEALKNLISLDDKNVGKFELKLSSFREDSNENIEKNCAIFICLKVIRSSFDFGLFICFCKIDFETTKLPFWKGPLLLKLVAN